MNLADYWIPYTISQVVFLFLLFACWRWFFLGRLLWIIVFLAGGCFNFYTAATQSDAYLMYADSALIPLYKEFINGEFARHTAVYVKSIAIGQIAVSLLLMGRTIVFKLGCFGGILFLLAISPLGLGSALPATLIGALALALLWRRGAKESIFHPAGSKMS